MWAKTGPQLRRLPMYHCRLLEGQVLWCGSSLGNRPWQVDHVVLLHIEEGFAVLHLAFSATRDASKLVEEFLPQMGSPQPLSSLQLFSWISQQFGKSFCRGECDYSQAGIFCKFCLCFGQDLLQLYCSENCFKTYSRICFPACSCLD